jgi:tRNA G10  N-methylase Trm11
MKLAFILGKNYLLSIAEILAYYSARNVKYKLLSHSKEILLLDTDLPDIDKLGGTIKVVEIKQTGPLESFDLSQLLPDIKEKAFFGISMYGKTKSKKLIKSLATKLQKEQRSEGKKYKAFLPPRGTSLTHVEVLKKNLLDSAEIVIFELKSNTYLGKTIQVHNPFEFQKRDIDRPIQRKALNIPPRLAKILINLTEAESGILLDPFCGIGTILMEAMLHGFEVYGVDNDKTALTGCKKNLSWIQKQYGTGTKYNLINADSKKLTNNLTTKIDAVATEPSFGPLLKRKPHYMQVEKTLLELKELYEEVFAELHKIMKPGSRIAITAPRFTIGKKYFSIDFDLLAKKTGFKIIDPLPAQIPHKIPLTDAEKRHIIIREIHVLEK